jgi:23S rRNA (cytosine1962-C5)-methyltransferase
VVSTPEGHSGKTGLLPQGKVLVPDWDAYSLLDSGGRAKLERFGERRLVRGEPKAWWQRTLPESAWSDHTGRIGDKDEVWRRVSKGERDWLVAYKDLRFQLRLTDMSKHVGIFPEQEPHWRWIDERIRCQQEPEILNLFGYTGAASLVAAAAGAKVTHVDASKPSLSWARLNQQLSKLEEAPIRWLLDDAFKFVTREVRRGRTYSGILLDPPSFGRGPKGEIWKVENQIVQLLQQIKRLLKARGSFVVLTLYNLEASPLMLRNLMQSVLAEGTIEFGELALPGGKEGQLLLPLSLYCRWSSAA